MAAEDATSDVFVLTLACLDRPGIVLAVSSFLVDHDCNITQSQQYFDRAAGVFFMRVEFERLTGPVAIDELRRSFVPVADRLGMTWQIVDARARARVLIMVSRLGHCLNDLLFRRQSGTLRIEVPAIVSNHTDLAPMAASYGVPFVHLPVTPASKPEAEARLLELVEEQRVDVVVLARYMQVLTEPTCNRLAGRAINIHHSFLPSFKGAKPYHQAHDRGVKLIGATAHYVTADLDEGPIIEQDVVRVDHTDDPERLAAAGRDVECMVLARAVAWHTDHRVLLNGNRTVVFR